MSIFDDHIARRWARERALRAATPSGNAGAAKLREYWVHGEGAAKIDWGVPGDFKRCTAELGKYVDDPEGLCANYHHEALGVWPGRE